MGDGVAVPTGYWAPSPGRRRRHVLIVATVVAFCIGGVAGISAYAIYRLHHLHISIPLPPPPSSYGLNLVLSPDGNTAYVTEPARDRLLVLDTQSGAVLSEIATGPTPSGLALSPNGQQIWVVDTNVPGLTTQGTVTVVSTSTYSVLGTIDVGSGPIDVAFSPDGSRAYVTNNGAVQPPGSVSIIDTASLQLVGELNPPNPNVDWNPTSVAVSADGAQVWVSEAETIGASQPLGMIYVFDAHTGAVISQIKVGRGPFFMTLPTGGHYAYVADKLSCDTKQIDTSTYQIISTVQMPVSHGCPFGLAAAGSTSTAFIVTGNDETVNLGVRGDAFEIVSFNTSHVAVSRLFGSDPVTVTLNPAGTEAYVVVANEPKIYVLNTRDGSVIKSLSVPHATPRGSSTTA